MGDKDRYLLVVRDKILLFNSKRHFRLKILLDKLRRNSDRTPSIKEITIEIEKIRKDIYEIQKSNS